MPIKLMAAVPTHSATMVVQCVDTLLGLQRLLLQRGDDFEFLYQTGATISQVRNLIVAAFLASDADVLLMLDADQAMSPSDIMRMLDFKKSFVGVICPRRAYDWSRVTLSETTTTETVVQQAMRFVGWLKTESDGQVNVVDGFSLATHVGTGILLLRREVFTRLMDFYPGQRARGFGTDVHTSFDPGERWGFFNPIENNLGIPLSEDLSFCRRWSEAGGEIWADIVSPTSHIGPHAFAGSYFDHLAAAGAS